MSTCPPPFHIPQSLFFPLPGNPISIPQPFLPNDPPALFPPSLPLPPPLPTPSRCPALLPLPVALPFFFCFPPRRPVFSFFPGAGAGAGGPAEGAERWCECDEEVEEEKIRRYLLASPPPPPPPLLLTLPCAGVMERNWLLVGEVGPPRGVLGWLRERMGPTPLVSVAW